MHGIVGNIFLNKYLYCWLYIYITSICLSKDLELYYLIKLDYFYLALGKMYNLIP